MNIKTIKNHIHPFIQRNKNSQIKAQKIVNKDKYINEEIKYSIYTKIEEKISEHYLYSFKVTKKKFIFIIKKKGLISSIYIIKSKH